MPPSLSRSSAVVFDQTWLDALPFTRFPANPSSNIQVQMEDGETHRPIVYILCVIDILQAYDLGKKAENLIKSQRSNTEDKNEISAVNPKTYRARFIAYLGRFLVFQADLNLKLKFEF